MGRVALLGWGPAEAQLGKRFVLQGGDCAETLLDCKPGIIANKLKILLQMSMVLVHAGQKPVVRIGRLAGQYAKPRSKPTEERDGVSLPSYFGDLVNRPEFTAAARRADPRALLDAYGHAALTLNFVRSLTAAGFADLHHPEYWVNLHYEAAQTRKVPRREGHYLLTTHMPWIGERTRNLGGAHVEFFRGIQNVVGVKLGPKVDPRDAVELLTCLNPKDEPRARDGLDDRRQRALDLARAHACDADKLLAGHDPRRHSLRAHR